MRLPGEAMQIDRIMEKFAEKYFRDNQKFQDAEGKQYFSNADSVFTLAFATIMLATDRHNAMIVDKIELSQWKHVRKFILFLFFYSGDIESLEFLLLFPRCQSFLESPRLE
jgi:hypothetical protein